LSVELAAVALPPRKAMTVAKAAGLIMAGQVVSRFLGFARDSVTAALFGQSGPTDAFFAAQTVPTQVYDLLVGTTITAALIPIFSEHADGDDLAELWRIVSVVISLAVLLLTGGDRAWGGEAYDGGGYAVSIHRHEQGPEELA